MRLLHPLIKRFPSRIGFALSASFLIAASLFFSSVVLASPAELKSQPDFYLPLVGYSQKFVDESKELSLENVMANPTYFKPIKTPYIDFSGVLTGQGWLKFSLLNSTGEKGLWRLDVNRQYYHSLNIYAIRNGVVEQIMRHSTDDSYYDRPVLDRMLGVDIQFDSGELVDVYLSIKGKASTFMPLAVGTVEATLGVHSNEHTLNWLNNGAMLTFIGFAVLLTSVIGWRMSLSFSLYILAGFAYVFHNDGYTFVHLWPNHMHINDSMTLSLMVMMPFFGLMFCRSLFNFKKHAPRFDSFLIGYFFVAAFVALFSFYLIEHTLLKIFAFIIPPLGSVSQFLAGIIALRKRLLGAKPYFVGAIVVIVAFSYAVMANSIVGQFNHDMTLDVGHFALVIEGLAFIAAIATRLIGIRNERDKALEHQLTTLQEKLQLSTELKKAQDDFIQARRVADMRRNQLSSVSHDLQQPLLSLRNALSRISSTDEDAAQQMHNAFDYLEALAREQLGVEGKEDTQQTINSSIECFPVNIVLDNVREMFIDEAKESRMELRFRSLSTEVYADPVAFMRALSNLVSNAIKHSGANTILLAARRKEGRVRVEVWDNGGGMTDEELSGYLQRHKKGEGSQGDGLGLSIVKNISDEHSLSFDMKSAAGRGSVAFLYLPTKR